MAEGTNLLLGAWYLAGIGFLGVYHREVPRGVGRAVARLFGVGTLWWLGAAWLGSAHRGTMLGLAAAAGVAATEVVLALAETEVPHGYPILYALSLVISLASPWWQPRIAPSTVNEGLGVMVGLSALAVLTVAARCAPKLPRLLWATLSGGTVVAGLFTLRDVMVSAHHGNLWWSAAAGFGGWLWMLQASRVTPTAYPSSRQAGISYGQKELDQGPVGVLTLELTGFDAWGAVHGHLAGEQLGQEVVRHLRRAARRQDRVVWLGGGQALLMFPGIPYEHEQVVRDRVMRVMRQIRVTGSPGSEPCALQVHLGWAWGEAGAAFEHVLGEADRAMQEDKRRRQRAEAGG